MTRDETKQILLRISSLYANWKPQADLRFVVESWWECLSEYSYEQVRMAVRMYGQSDLSGFAPTPGQLIAMIQKTSGPAAMSEIEAWSLVSKAIRNGAYGAEEEFAKLPQPIQKVLGSPSQLKTWAVDEEYNESVVSSQFMRSYRIIVERNEEIARMPEKVRLLIESINPNPTVKAIEKKDDPPAFSDWSPLSDKTEEGLKKLKEMLG